MTTPDWADRMVVGAAQFGQDYGSGAIRTPPNQHAVLEILQEADALGIHQLDTARAYGNSEDAVGRARGVLPLRVVTKIRPLGPRAGDEPAHVAAAVRHSIADSLRALRTDAVDTVLLHRGADLDAGAGSAVAALADAVANGQAARWGVSLSTPTELLAALRHPGLGYVQLPFNLLDRRWTDGPVQRALQGRPDVQVTARSVLLQGLLTDDDAGRWPRGVEFGADRARHQLRELRRRLSITDPLALPIGYALAQPWIDAVVLGVRRREQLVQLAAAVRSGPLPAEQIDLIHETLAPGSPELVDPSRWP